LPPLVDSLPGVRGYLLSNADVVAKVATRVYGTEFPSSYPKNSNNLPLAGVLINHSGGGRNMSLPVAQDTYDLRCYAPTTWESIELWNAVAGALKELNRTTINNVMLWWVRLNGPITLREIDTEWPVTFSVFTVASSEVI
jgi:hypothetical protein